MAGLFCSADEGAAGDVFSEDCKIAELTGESRVKLSADCGRVLWSIDEEGIVRLAGVLLPDMVSQA